jgi:hypothetical protein
MREYMLSNVAPNDYPPTLEQIHKFTKCKIHQVHHPPSHPSLFLSPTHTSTNPLIHPCRPMPTHVVPSGEVTRSAAAPQ